MSTKPKSEPAIPVLPNGEAETRPCWSCGDMRAAYFCSSCGKVQPPAPTDFFSFFGLPRKLNLDPAELEQEMFALSRRLHPDLYARATHEEQDWSLQQTSKLNDAYRTLRDPILRTEYLLRLEGVKSGQQSKQATELARATGSKKQAVPPGLLEEVFELNLQLEEFRASRGSGADPAGLRQELELARKALKAKMEALAGELQACWQQWDSIIVRETAGEAAADDPDLRRRILEQIVDVLNRRRYLDNLVREISTALSE
jgi:molecular chaperone HscB